MNHAYFRVSTSDQSIESQRSSLLASCGLVAFDKEYIDLGISGATLASSRQGFSDLKAYVRTGDTVFVASIDRLGRDAIDIQTVVRDLLAAGVKVFVVGLGLLDAMAGQIVVAVLAQVAQLERTRITERTAAGRKVAKDLLKRTGKTQHGKTSLGRPLENDPQVIALYRATTGSSISVTAKYFSVSTATVKRACRQPSLVAQG